MSKKIKVLYVEDEQDIRENIVEILKDEGFEVFDAENGKIAVEIFLDNNPDIIVSDIMMPEVSGYDLLKIIRNNKNIPNNNIPFIFLSALGEKEDIMKGIGLTANDYLTKPIDFDLLIAKIKEKYNNLKQLEESHKDNIDGLKNQVSGILPNELTKYIGQIRDISKLLKTEPYGPLPHRRYLEDIGRIYSNCMKLKALTDSFLTGEAIQNQVNSGEDILDPKNLISEFTSSIEEELKPKISFNNDENLPKIKINKKLLLDLTRRIFKSALKIDINCNTRVSAVEDHLGQLVFIFSLESNKIEEKPIKELINIDKVNSKIEKDGYNIEAIFRDDEVSILLHIPSYRVIKQ